VYSAVGQWKTAAAIALTTCSTGAGLVSVTREALARDSPAATRPGGSGSRYLWLPPEFGPGRGPLVSPVRNADREGATVGWVYLNRICHLLTISYA